MPAGTGINPVETRMQKVRMFLDGVKWDVKKLSSFAYGKRRIGMLLMKRNIFNMIALKGSTAWCHSPFISRYDIIIVCVPPLYLLLTAGRRL